MKKIEDLAKFYKEENNILSPKISLVLNHFIFQKHTLSEISKEFNFQCKLADSKFDRKSSLIDEIVESESIDGILGEQVAVENVDKIITNIRNLQNDCQLLIAELKENVYYILKIDQQ